MTTKRRRTDLTLGQKVEFVSLMERERPSQAELSRHFNCSQSTVSNITKNKDAILHDAEENKSASRKWKRSSKDDDIDAALYTWFVDARAWDAPITSAVLEEKANHFASALNNDFKATNGWLYRWKVRHGIKFKKAHGEKKDANVTAAET